MGNLSPLASVAKTREVLEAHGLSTKYSLGQNFLINDAILQKIVTLADLSPRDFVLEVGPGIGTLTIALLKSAGQVVSVERDPDLPAVLAETLAPWSERFTLLSKDALDLIEDEIRLPALKTTERMSPEPEQISLASGQARLTHGQARLAHGQTFPAPEQVPSASGQVPSEPFGEVLPNKLVANLPYAVAATVVLDYFEKFSSLESATVMVQKEVADRMAAQPGSKNYGAYTVKLRLYAQPAGRFAVGPGNFFPPPRVESAVLRLNRRIVLDESGCPLDQADIKAACIMAEAAFATRRKTISNSCKTYFAGRGAQGSQIIALLPHMFEWAGIDPKRRGETLDIPEFIKLGKTLRTFQENQ